MMTILCHVPRNCQAIAKKTKKHQLLSVLEPRRPFHHVPPMMQAGVTIPAPTWSVASLKLDQKHEPVSMEELDRLARRALIDVRSTGGKNGLDIDLLRQDLGNMMQMIKQVQQFQADTNSSSAAAVAVEVQGSEDPTNGNGRIYDCHRGTPQTRVREENNASDSKSQQEAQQVWKSLLKPRTTAVGSHAYFVVETDKGTQGESS